jgi:hypothetical protein
VEALSCVYISTQSTVREKAKEMMKNVIRLNLFVKENKLGLNGNPMVLVKNWSPAYDSIHFDFCFPILHPELIPEVPDIKFKTVSIEKALKADFFGNYSISDFSWNLLYLEAQKQGKNSTGRIIEVFYDDPHAGGNDLHWKAGIYLEIDK